MEKYSVLMSVYKNENSEYFKQAMDSMINQTLRPSEIVLIEDGPLTDSLYEAIEKYKNEHPNLFVIIKNKENIGLGLSLNKGIACCTYDYIARMDTDDISEIDRCEKQMEILLQKNIDVVGSNITEYDYTMSKVVGFRDLPEKNFDIHQYLKKRCPFNHQSVMFRKEAVLNAGNYQHYLYNEDYFLWIKMSLNNCKFYNIQDSLVKVRTSPNLYARRGGLKYYKSEKQIQKFMYQKKLIGYFQYKKACFIRFIVQVIMTKKMRSFFYSKFLRRKKKC